MSLNNLYRDMDMTRMNIMAGMWTSTRWIYTSLSSISNGKSRVLFIPIQWEDSPSK